MNETAQNLFNFVKTMALTAAIGSPIAAATTLAATKPEAILMIASKVQSVQLGDFKVALGEKAFNINDDLTKKFRDDPGGQWRIVQLAGRLGPREIDRLLNVLPIRQTQQQDASMSCDYEKSNARMRYYSAADRALAENGLIKIVARPDVTEKERSNGGSPEFGMPYYCYQTEMTDDGFDAKSVIVSEMTRFFQNGAGADRKPAEEKTASARPKEKV